MFALSQRLQKRLGSSIQVDTFGLLSKEGIIERGHQHNQVVQMLGGTIVRGYGRIRESGDGPLKQHQTWVRGGCKVSSCVIACISDRYRTRPHELPQFIWHPRAQRLHLRAQQRHKGLKKVRVLSGSLLMSFALECGDQSKDRQVRWFVRVPGHRPEEGLQQVWEKRRWWHYGLGEIDTEMTKNVPVALARGRQ